MKTTKRGKRSANPILDSEKALRQAHKRINGNPTRKLRWLLTFACELDLDALNEKQTSEIAWEVAMFGLGATPDDAVKESSMAWMDLHMLTVDFGPPVTKHDRVPDSTIRHFQGELRKAFNDLFSGGWKYVYPHKEEFIALSNVGYARASNPPTVRPLDLLMAEAAKLIKAEQTRLRICDNPRCKKKFVATKQNARFHNSTCSAYVRVYKQRGKPLT